MYQKTSNIRLDLFLNGLFSWKLVKTFYQKESQVRIETKFKQR